jgi:ElaB/YqjD/DUF883 family membrane-anchored ribosome-binding protein
MEPRTKDLTGDIKRAGMEAQEIASEAAQELGYKARAAGTAIKEGAKVAYRAAQEKTIVGAKATDRAIHESPYYSMGIAFGAGLLLGFLLKRK